MKRRILGVLLMLLLMISMGLTASAATKETYFEEEGIRYCWVRGDSTDKPTEKVQGYTWIEVREGNRQVTQIGACDEHGIIEHDCGDIWDRYDRLEYKWKLVVKELLVIECRDEAGYSMEGSAFMLLKESIERDESGNPVIYTDENGEQWVQRDGNDVVVCKALVGVDGYAKMRLEQESEYDNRLDWTKSFHQLVLVQNLNPDPDMNIEDNPMLNEYRPLEKRWYVNMLMNSDGEYEVHSITEAPPIKTDNYNELKNYHFDELTEGFVPEYDSKSQIMYLRNSYRVGKLIFEINVEGFDGEIPSAVRTNIDITGPHEYSKRVRKSETLEGMRMGEYTIKYSEPVTMTGYTEKEPEVKITLQQPVESEAVELTEAVNTVKLHRDAANAVLNITYTYYPNHVHTYDEGVVTSPTCTTEGYTIYTCTGYLHDGEKCTKFKREDVISPYGHGFEERVIPPTCEEEGYTEFSCADCDYSYMDDYTDAIGHSFKHTGNTEAGCEEDGKKIFTCENCEAVEEEIIQEAFGHDLQFQKVVEATCTEKGYNLYVCNNCSKELQEVRDDMPAGGHTYGAGVETKPTCTAKGYKTYTCTVKECGYSYDGDYTNALGHKYVEEVVEPTEEREGYTLHTCSVCKDSYTDNHKDKLSSKKPSGGSGGSSGGSGQSANKNNAANISGSASDTLVVQFFDDKNQPLNSGMVALYDGKTQLKSWSCTYGNVAVVDNLEKYAKDGEVVAYILKQSKAMDGYEVAKDTFTVQLHKEGANLKVNVKKNKGIKGATKATKVENGRDGKPIISFSNTKKTTQFEIACKASVEFDGNCIFDEAMIAEYMKKEYKFTLNWTGEDGEAKTETIKLADGGSGIWRAKIPFGTQYQITAEDLDRNVITGFSEEASGTLTGKQMDAKVKIEADIQYKVKPDSANQLEINVVDSGTGTALRGANFELKGPDGVKIATYISRENGKFYMEDVFPELGSYLMVQNKAPEGYAALKGDIPVIVSLAYTPQSENNVHTLMQSKAVEFAHQAVDSDGNGIYTIENDSQIVIKNSAGKGGKTGMILGVAGGVAALGAAGAVTYTVIKKKRGKNIVSEETE